MLNACLEGDDPHGVSSSTGGGRPEVKSILLRFHAILKQCVTCPHQRRICVMKIMPTLMMGKDMTGYPANMRPGLVVNKITHDDFVRGKLYIIAFLWAYGDARLMPSNPREEEEKTDSLSIYIYIYI